VLPSIACQGWRTNRATTIRMATRAIRNPITSKNRNSSSLELPRMGDPLLPRIIVLTAIRRAPANSAARCNAKTRRGKILVSRGNEQRGSGWLWLSPHLGNTRSLHPRRVGQGVRGFKPLTVASRKTGTSLLAPRVSRRLARQISPLNTGWRRSSQGSERQQISEELGGAPHRGRRRLALMCSWASSAPRPTQHVLRARAARKCLG